MKAAQHNTQKGFTLIELMVSIAIVGILATIGLTAFSTTQASARDGRRRSEVEQIAKSIELSKDGATNLYRYTSANFTTDFARNAAPQLLAYNDPSSVPYCVLTSNNATPASTTVPADWTSTTCPGSYQTLSTQIVVPGTPVSNRLYAGDVTSWVICAHMERTTPFCVNSSQ